MSMILVDEATEVAILEAPPTVRDVYYSTQEWLDWWCEVANLPEPSEPAINDAFWNQFAKTNGTDDDFDWMVEHDLCDEADRADMLAARAAA